MHDAVITPPLRESSHSRSAANSEIFLRSYLELNINIIIRQHHSKHDLEGIRSRNPTNIYMPKNKNENILA